MQVDLRAAALLDCGRGAEMIGMVMGSEQDVDVLDLDVQCSQRLLQRLDAVGQVHTGIDQRPSAVAIDQPDVDDGGPGRERQEDFVDSRMYFNDLRTHLYGPRQD